MASWTIDPSDPSNPRNRIPKDYRDTSDPITENTGDPITDPTVSGGGGSDDPSITGTPTADPNDTGVTPETNNPGIRNPDVRDAIIGNRIVGQDTARLGNVNTLTPWGGVQYKGIPGTTNYLRHEFLNPTLFNTLNQYQQARGVPGQRDPRCHLPLPLPLPLLPSGAACRSNRAGQE